MIRRSSFLCLGLALSFTAALSADYGVTNSYGTNVEATPAPTVAPTVTSIDSTKGTTAGSKNVSLTGTNLTGTTGVTFGGTAATNVVVVSATSVTATTPAHAAGAVDVVATTPGGNGRLTSGYTYVTPPTITAISPNWGTMSGGTWVTITGTGLSGPYGTWAVYFCNCDPSEFQVISDTEVKAKTPVWDINWGNPGTTQVGVGYADSDIVLGPAFTFFATPSISSISATSGATAGGTSVTLTGTNLNGIYSVTFDGTAATDVLVNNATSVTVTSPAHAAGAVDVVATTLGGNATLTSGFTYVVPTVNGACGSANNTASAFAPSANLCSAGAAGSVANASPWTWTCAGSGPSHTDASCSAPNATVPGSGSGRAVVAVTNNWVVDAANSLGFVAASSYPAMPAGATAPYGMLGTRLMTGTPGSAATMTITYPAALPAGTVYWKYGKTAANPTSHWYPFAGAVVSGNTITLTITDGGNGDDDLTANSVIVDPGGPGAAADVPTLPEWALLFLALALGGLGYAGLRQRRLLDVRTRP